MRTRQTALHLARILILGALVGAVGGCSGGSGDSNDGMTPPPSQTGDVIGVTSSNRIMTFNRMMPSASSAVPITGLQSGENILGIDVRPSDNALYALTDGGRIYTINSTSGAATLRSTLRPDPADTSSPFSGLSGGDYGVDFNPVVDRLRVVSSNGQNLRISVDDGTTITDNSLVVGATPRMGVSAVGYTTNFSSACRTTAYLIDVVNDRLLTSANLTTGVLTDIGGLGVDVSTVSGYEIVTGSDGSDTALAALTAGGATSLYSINLSTGAVAASPPAIAGLNAGESVTGIAIVRTGSVPSQPAGNMLAVSETNRVVSFNTNVPRKLCTSAQMTGLSSGERVLGIDTRPADGLLYAVGSSGKIYTVDPATGNSVVRSTMVADPADTTNPFTSLSGTEFAFEFNPVANQARMLSDTGLNARIDVDTGLTSTDTALNPVGPVVTSIAYSNGFAGAGSITAYVIDVNLDRLMTLGGVSGSAVNGDLQSVGLLNVGDVGPIASLEIDGTNSMAFAALNVNGATTSDFFNINVTNGSATRVDTIGGGERIRGLAIAKVPVATVVAVTADNRLVSFKPLTPGSFDNNVAVSGLQGGESLVGIDYRPANGLLYGLTNSGRIYTLNAMTGAATMVAGLSADPGDASAPFTSLTGTSYGFDFNPVVDRIRLFSDVEQNIRSSADDGTTFTDGNLNRGPFTVTSAAYTNSFPGSTSTTLYDIDTQNDVLLIQAPQNDGTLAVVGPLRMDAALVSSFEIVGPGTAFAAMNTATTANGFYTINLATGAATLVDVIRTANGGDRVTGLSAAPSVNTPAPNSTVFAIVNGNSLTSFARNAPGSAPNATPLSGLQGGESIVGADFRPANGVLYALTNQGRVYSIDTTGGSTATLTATLTTPLSGANFAVDFSPLADLLRTLSDTGMNYAINVTTGAVITATNLNFPQPDIVAVGYTQNYAGATVTRALVLDAPTNSLFQVNPTANGTLIPIGRLDPALTFTSTAAFDITGGDNGLSIAALQPTGASQSTLYRVNPITGAAVPLGPIGPSGTTLIGSLAIQLK